MDSRKSVYVPPRRGVAPGRRSGRGLSQLFTMLAAVGIVVIGGLVLQDSDLASRFLAEPAPATAAYAARSFPLCAGPSRHTCVVDGDTFWLDGTKIRIADINTPETGSPQCASEAAMGRRATERLAELLNAGPFSLVSVDRDEDQYGRKLRIVERGGRSLGDMMVAEGLAHEWRGRRESWC